MARKEAKVDQSGAVPGEGEGAPLKQLAVGFTFLPSRVDEAEVIISRLLLIAHIAIAHKLKQKF